MICGTKWKGCDCPWFNYGGGDAEQMDEPMPNMRGDLHDIFDGRDPPTTTELRGSRMRRHTRPQTYEEEMVYRRLQEDRDLEMARRMQIYDEVEEIDSPDAMGESFGVGNTMGHFMNDDYRRSGYGAVSAAPAPPISYDRVSRHVANVGRARGSRSGSMERRLADRLSGERGTRRRQSGPTPAPAPMWPMSPGHYPMAPMCSPLSSPPLGPGHFSTPRPASFVLQPRMTSGYPGERSVERMLDYGYREPRSERASRTSKYYEEDSIYSPSRSSRTREMPSSSLAGLSGQGHGMNRVFEWRNFVRPGVPEELGVS